MVKLILIAIIIVVAIPFVLCLFKIGFSFTKSYEKGETIYRKHCIGCHGEKGDGRGLASKFLAPRPRDFTSGIFKFTTTPPNSLPTDENLIQILTNGIYWTAMPSWSLLQEKEKNDVLKYIKTFSDRWKYSQSSPPFTISNPPNFFGKEESIAKGKELYTKVAGCLGCHGEKGRSDGPRADLLQDNWGNHIKPANLSKWRIKRGESANNIFITLKTGVKGTPMPSFANALCDEELWHIVSFIWTLRNH